MGRKFSLFLKLLLSWFSWNLTSCLLSPSFLWIPLAGGSGPNIPLGIWGSVAVKAAAAGVTKDLQAHNVEEFRSCVCASVLLWRSKEAMLPLVVHSVFIGVCRVLRGAVGAPRPGALCPVVLRTWMWLMPLPPRLGILLDNLGSGSWLLRHAQCSQWSACLCGCDCPGEGWAQKQAGWSPGSAKCPWVSLQPLLSANLQSLMTWTASGEWETHSFFLRYVQQHVVQVKRFQFFGLITVLCCA